MRIRHLTPLFAAVVLFSGCDPQNTYNDEAKKQNTAEADAKKDELKQAVGDYCGSVHLNQDYGDEDFAANLTLQIVPDNVHSSTSTDPTDTVQVPKLAGSMTFPAIRAEGIRAYMTLPNLMKATGGFYNLSFTYGDYNKSNHMINLPFSVSGGGQGNFGSVSGKLEGNEFTGIWDSESSQPIGTFTFIKGDGCSS